jgi:hypothetical protein
MNISYLFILLKLKKVCVSYGEIHRRSNGNKEGNGRFVLIMEAPLVSAVATIATVSGVLRFALMEWEGVVKAWMRVSRSRSDFDILTWPLSIL